MRWASTLGVGLAALAAVCGLVWSVKSGFGAMTAWAEFLAVYGLCIWQANRRGASHYSG